jgi:endogenous inhibitor of DNA gyrase (YacG/DUF329 family)
MQYRVGSTERVCGTCNTRFMRRNSKKDWPFYFCSKKCLCIHLSKIRLSEHKEDFWVRVKKTNSCWLWIGAKQVGPKNKNPNKCYGKVRINTRIVRAHRAAWELVYAKIPKGLMVLHTCDNPPCVNPLHLYLGSDVENARDRMYRKDISRLFK